MAMVCRAISGDQDQDNVRERQTRNLRNPGQVPNEGGVPQKASSEPWRTQIVCVCVCARARVRIFAMCSPAQYDKDLLSNNWRKPAKSKGDGTKNVINCRKLSQIVMTFYDEFYDVL